MCLLAYCALCFLTDHSDSISRALVMVFYASTKGGAPSGISALSLFHPQAEMQQNRNLVGVLPSEGGREGHT